MLNFLAAIGSATVGAAGSFESIATATGTGSSGTISFTSIPSNFQHLQIRYQARTSSGGDTIIMRFNSDSGGNYTRHWIFGAGGAPAANASTAISSINVGSFFNGTDATFPTVGLIDIHDYRSTTKNKTVRTFTGMDANTYADVTLSSGLWINTNAITSITISVSTNFLTGSTFALYGIKGA